MPDGVVTDAFQALLPPAGISTTLSLFRAVINSNVHHITLAPDPPLARNRLRIVREWA
jgi:hypothetical protein